MITKIRRKIGCASDVIPNVDSTFEKACLYLLTESFKRMKDEGFYVLAWKETCFSASLIGYMRKIRKEWDWALRIDPESHLYHQRICESLEDPDTAKRIDLKISGNWVYEDIYYGIEAKILVEKNWKKRDAGKLCKRYIDTGIDNFVKGHYSDKVPLGCITGYIVQGDAANIATKINDLLIGCGRKKEVMGDLQLFNKCSNCYRSRHKRITNNEEIKLRHLFLTFCQ